MADRVTAVSPKVGGEELLLRYARVSEEMGRLFEIELDLESKNLEITAKDLLGKHLSVSLIHPKPARHFDGIVTAFSNEESFGQYASYHVSLRPWLWLLTRTSNCKIFQNKKIPDIIEDVFRDHGLTDFKNDLSGTYEDLEYCVQYRESDFDFVSRLMERVGIYYYFEHEEGKHTLVLADAVGAHTKKGTINFYPPNTDGIREEEHIDTWASSHSIQPGEVLVDSFDFAKPKVDLKAKSSITRQHDKSDFEVYDYPEHYQEIASGEAYAKVRIQELHTRHQTVSAAGNFRAIGAGELFTLDRYPRKEQNKEHLVIASVHEFSDISAETGGGGSAEHRVRLEAIDSKEVFRTERQAPIPVMRGPQTAIVVGKSGEEIWTDEHGRIKVQFHWDREGKKDQESSCWIRVAQIWAGKGFGGMALPRIGQEVIVEFLEGNPDRPIVTGRVYNGDNKPPWALPANATQSGIQTRSSKGGSDENFNELRFEDKKGEEQIYFHAEKDFVRIVENNDTLTVTKDQKITIEKGDRTEEISEGKETILIKAGDRTVELGQGSDKLDIQMGDRTVELGQGSDKLTLALGDLTTSLDAGNMTTKLAAGKYTAQAMMAIELKVGASSIKIEPASITIKSPMVKIQADAMAEVKGAMVTVEGSAMLKAKGGITMIG